MTTDQTTNDEPTPEAPIYAKIQQERQERGGAAGHARPATPLYIITCDEGWRLSIVCDGMYEWAADWLLGVLGRQPYAPGARP
jgi:hypothetical protein